MQIYMTFVGPAGQLVERAPSCAWVLSTILLELMRVGPAARGEVGLSELQGGLMRARAVLSDPRETAPRMVRTEGERRVLVALTELLEVARARAHAQGAVRFAWREDF